MLAVYTKIFLLGYILCSDSFKTTFLICMHYYYYFVSLESANIYYCHVASEVTKVIILYLYGFLPG